MGGDQACDDGDGGDGCKCFVPTIGTSNLPLLRVSREGPGYDFWVWTPTYLKRRVEEI